MGSASSPLVLSLATVFALLGIVLVAIAFGTNDWQKLTVERSILKEAVKQGDPQLEDYFRNEEIETSDLTYTRTYGLFRECFPTSDTPKDLDFFTAPLGSSCINRRRDYQIPEDNSVTSGYTAEETTRMHLLRTQVAFYITGLAILCICLFVGVAGCWKRSSSLILTTGILSLFATLFLAASMAVWHGIDYLQEKVIKVKPYYQSWPDTLQHATKFDYGWSYMVSWIGIGFILISSIMMLLAFRAMKEEEWVSDPKQGPYMMAQNGNGYYDKQAMMAASPFAAGAQYATYGYNAPAGPAYPGTYYSNYGQSPFAGYLTYGR